MNLLTLKPTGLGRYAAMHPDHGELCRSRTPFFDASRKLLKLGHAPDEPIEAHHEGSPTVAMRGTLGEAAKWTVDERDRGNLRKRRWQPYWRSPDDGPETCACSFVEGIENALELD